MKLARRLSGVIGFAVCLLSSSDEFGSGEVFQGTAHAFEGGNLVRTSADRFFPAHQLMEVREDVVAGDHAVIEGYEEIAGFGEDAFESIDNDAGTLHGGIVDFASVWLEGADEIEVSSIA
jgi:hypothetical protein